MPRQGVCNFTAGAAGPAGTAPPPEQQWLHGYERLCLAPCSTGRKTSMHARIYTQRTMARHPRRLTTSTHSRVAAHIRFCCNIYSSLCQLPQQHNTLHHQVSQLILKTALAEVMVCTVSHVPMTHSTHVTRCPQWLACGQYTPQYALTCTVKQVPLSGTTILARCTTPKPSPG